MLNKGKGRIQELVLLLADGRCSEDLRALNLMLEKKMEIGSITIEGIGWILNS